MPNSYATVPNILPGNVTIGGNLTVSGDTIRIGAATPFTRVQKLPAGGASISYNVDRISAVTDLAQQNLWLMMLESGALPLQGRWHDGIGGSNTFAVPMALGWTGVTTNVTGTVAETTVFSVSIRGGFFGASGGLRFWWAPVAAAQGGVATTLRVKLGATAFFSVATATVDSWLIHGAIMNQNATGLQKSYVYSQRGAVLNGPVESAPAENTLNTLTLAFTIQPGAVGDNWNSRQGQVEPFVSRNVPL